MAVNVTGIGSLPHQDITAGLELIRRYMGDWPHWPQFPALGWQEEFVPQYVSPLMELGLVEKRGTKLVFATDNEDFALKLADFYELYLAAQAGDRGALTRFGLSATSAAGLYALVAALKAGDWPARGVKGQLSGPITIGFQLLQPDGRAAYYDAQLRDVILKACEMGARWQTRFLLEETGLPTIVSVDDPGIYALGLSTHITLTREGIKEDLTVVMQAIKEEGGRTGLHCCAGTDWSMVMECPLDLLFFDAYEFLTSLLVHAPALQGYLQRGGEVAWGLVPTSPRIEQETAESLAERWQSVLTELAQRGIERELVVSRSWLTPSCGTGTLSVEAATRVYHITAELAEKIF